MKLPRLFAILAITGLVAASSAQASVTFINHSQALGEPSTVYNWAAFTEAGRPNGVATGVSGSSSQWLEGLKPDNASTNIHLTAPVSGQTTDFMSSGGLYTFFSATNFSLVSTSPLSNLKTLTFQINQIAGLTGPDFGSTGADFITLPSLVLQTSTGPVVLGATYSLLLSSTPTVSFGINTFVNHWGFQWDLASVTGTIESYSLNWQASYHEIINGFNVTESANIAGGNILAIPEPSTWSLLAGTAAIGLVMMRRKRAQAA